MAETIGKAEMINPRLVCQRCGLIGAYDFGPGVKTECQVCFWARYPEYGPRIVSIERGN